MLLVFMLFCVLFFLFLSLSTPWLNSYYSWVLQNLVENKEIFRRNGKLMFMLCYLLLYPSMEQKPKSPFVCSVFVCVVLRSITLLRPAAMSFPGVDPKPTFVFLSPTFQCFLLILHPMCVLSDCKGSPWHLTGKLLGEILKRLGRGGGYMKAGKQTLKNC